MHYLLVNPEVWFEWHVEKRVEYTRKFNELTVEDVAKKKVISLDKHHGKEDTEQEWKEFSRDIQSIYSLPGLSVGLVTSIHVQYTRTESDRLGYATVRLTGSLIAGDLEKYTEVFTEGVKCWRMDSIGHGRTRPVSLCVGSTERKSDRERLRKIH